MDESRRSFLKKGLVGSTLLAASSLNCEQVLAGKVSGHPSTKGNSIISTVEDTKVQIFSKDVRQPVRLVLISDTHLWMSDEREAPFRQYSDRMSKAYNQTRHFRTLAATQPKEQFEKTMEMVRSTRPDALFLLGDIVSYPSEAAIEWAKSLLDQTGVDYYYISGNHDWHYEGMPGSEIELRAEWTRRRLAPLYRGNDPLIYSVDIQGLRVLMLDNSTYEILPRQLQFFRDELKNNRPTLLMSHCPFYAPGFPVSYGCGHPEWKASTDRNYQIERRPQWPEKGHTAITFDFWNSIVEGYQRHHLLATFSGHVHRQSSSMIAGWPQFTLKPNLSGAYLEVTVNPLPSKF